MLNNEQAFFLQILSDYVAVRTSQFSSSIHWNTIVTYAEKHELSGIFYNQCKQFIPAEQLMSLERKNAAEHFYYANNLKEYARISAILKRNSIIFALFKGLKIAKVYPLSYNRTMGDFDFLVDASQISEIKDSFDSLGYKLEKDTPHEWSFRRSDFYIEVHEFLLNPETAEYRAAVSYFTTPWEHVCQIEETEYELDWNYHFIYLIQHIRQHLLWEGVGFRQFLDLALIIKNSSLDWDYIFETCRSIGLYNLLMVCMTFISRWFNVECPVLDDMDEQFYYEATAKIFDDGVFGFSNDANKISMIQSATRDSSKPLLFTKIKLAIGLAFPSYSSMVNTDKYGFLRNRSFLLPIAWILRAINALKAKRNRGLLLLKATVRANSRTIKERECALEKWGI